MTAQGDPSVTTPRRGRRRNAGEGAARAAILAAAGHEFTEHGYDATSLRGIARRAGVDAALVHHYFDGKAELFAQTIGAPVRPDQLVLTVLAGPREEIGSTLVRLLLANFDEARTRDRVIQLLRTALGHDFAATMIRQFLMREVFHRIATALGGDDAELRATLAASQIVGLIVARYGIRVEPLASAAPDEVVRRVGPAVQWHLTGYPAASPGR